MAIYRSNIPLLIHFFFNLALMESLHINLYFTAFFKTNNYVLSPTYLIICFHFTFLLVHNPYFIAFINLTFIDLSAFYLILNFIYYIVCFNLDHRYFNFFLNYPSLLNLNLVSTLDWDNNYQDNFGSDANILSLFCYKNQLIDMNLVQIFQNLHRIKDQRRICQINEIFFFFWIMDKLMGVLFSSDFFEIRKLIALSDLLMKCHFFSLIKQTFPFPLQIAFKIILSGQ